MKLKLDGIVKPELKEFLLSQEGITQVDLNYDNYLVELSIKHNKETTPNIIMKYIELFENTKFSNVFEFDKENIKNYKTLKYIIDDMCCEHCYVGLVMDLFENDKIKAVKSNCDFDKTFFNVEFTIDYSENYSESELIKFIKDNYK